MAEETKATKPVASVKKFAKEQILKSKKFANRKDLLSLLLAENEGYSIDEVDKLLNKELKRKVAK